MRSTHWSLQTCEFVMLCMTDCAFGAMQCMGRKCEATNASCSKESKTIKVSAKFSGSKKKLIYTNALQAPIYYMVCSTTSNTPPPFQCPLECLVLLVRNLDRGFNIFIRLWIHKVFCTNVYLRTPLLGGYGRLWPDKPTSTMHYLNGYEKLTCILNESWFVFYPCCMHFSTIVHSSQVPHSCPPPHTWQSPMAGPALSMNGNCPHPVERNWLGRLVPPSNTLESKPDSVCPQDVAMMFSPALTILIGSKSAQPRTDYFHQRYQHAFHATIMMLLALSISCEYTIAVQLLTVLSLVETAA